VRTRTLEVSAVEEERGVYLVAQMGVSEVGLVMIVFYI